MVDGETGEHTQHVQIPSVSNQAWTLDRGITFDLITLLYCIFCVFGFYRYCNNPVPFNGGNGCVGEEYDCGFTGSLKCPCLLYIYFSCNIIIVQYMIIVKENAVATASSTWIPTHCMKIDLASPHNH